MTERTQIQRGLEATQVLENPAYRDAMAALRTQVIDQWKACPVRDREGQLLLLQLAKLADKFEGLLAGAVESGKLAQHKIDVDSVRDESPARQFFRRVA
jgi:hypothetical protein